jgi:tRNA A-37 threonylcarbamoyl transferase component Bud32
VSDKPAASPSSDEFRASPIPAPLETALDERYEIVRETGHGASAIVYLARDLKHERLVALKMLSPDVSTTAGERFLREIQLAAGMQHPHILPMYDSGVAEGRLYFVMPFVDGGSLRQRLEAEPQLPLAEALRIAHDIALALAFAHDQGVVHRDVKPENIMFYHGHACLADFGVARAMEELDTRVTAHGMIVGTPAYMSPEQLTDGGFDGRSDVYSLACVLYETLAGVHAFSGSTPRELLRQRLRTPPPALMTHREDAPKFIEDLLARALAASPDSRYADARQFAEAIERAQQELIKPSRHSAPRRAIEAIPRHPMAWAGSLALVLALGGLAASPIRNIVRGRGSSRADVRAAAEAYTKGKAALERWDLTTAERELSNAVTANPRMAEAQLRLAQTLELERRIDSDQYRLAAARLTTLRHALHGRDSLLAAATISLAGRAYPRACETFSRMRAVDSLDALAWYGLGDCLSMDSAVVKDPKSPSGWSYRTSWSAAAQAYMRAAVIEPGAHRALTYATLGGLLPTTSMKIRAGRVADSTAAYMPAYPAVIDDTIAYVPVPMAMMAKMSAPATLPDALRRNRDVLVAFGRQWSSAEPNNPFAFEALSAGLEARGELAADDSGALGAIHRAERLSGSTAEVARLQATEVRLLMKRGEFEPARLLADSLLAPFRVGPWSDVDAERLVGLAALTGRVGLTAQLRDRSSSSDNADRGIAPQVTTVASQLFARAASGVCDDSLLVLKQAVDRLLDSYSQPTKRQEMRRSLVERPMLLAFPCLGVRATENLTSTLALARAQRAAAAGDHQVAALLLDSIARTREATRPGDVSLAFTVQEAWLRASIGDVAAATNQLDLVLNALPTLGVFAVREEAQSAAIGRALALRAELAAKTGDVVQRRQRAREALALWQHADPSMGPTLDRLRALASFAR